jgi:hypothetical protein
MGPNCTVPGIATSNWSAGTPPTVTAVGAAKTAVPGSAWIQAAISCGGSMSFVGALGS